MELLVLNFKMSELKCQVELFRWFSFIPIFLTADIHTCKHFSVSNGNVRYNEDQLSNGRYQIGAQFQYSCNSGYSRSTSSDAGICNSNGNWDNSNPKCNRSKEKCTWPSTLNFWAVIFEPHNVLMNWLLIPYIIITITMINNSILW